MVEEYSESGRGFFGGLYHSRILQYFAVLMGLVSVGGCGYIPNGKNIQREFKMTPVEAKLLEENGPMEGSATAGGSSDRGGVSGGSQGGKGSSNSGSQGGRGSGGQSGRGGGAGHGSR